MIPMVAMVFIMLMMIITATGMWIQVNELASTRELIVIGALTNNRACVCLSVVPMDTSMEDVTKVWIPPVTTWQKSAIKWDSLE